MLGSNLASHGWANIHFIAHSAGSQLIQSATEAIKSSSSSGTVIQCTFLDAFDGVLLGRVGEYGNGADWADSYFTHAYDTYDPIVHRTDQPLSHAYNVDVTQLDLQDKKPIPGFFSDLGVDAPCYETESVHSWPITFYSNTIVGSVSAEYQLFGFPLSQEDGAFLTSDRAFFPQGNDPAEILGTPDPICAQLSSVTTPAYIGPKYDFGATTTVSSPTGVFQWSPGSLQLGTGSPVWVASVATLTNPVNFISFDAQFTSAVGSEGLLSVYWDTNMVGLVDVLHGGPRSTDR